MAGPAMRGLALGELANNERMIESLLAEGESLFVEHKSDIAKGEGIQIAKAAASFANTLGGWILIGVDNKGVPIPDWQPPPGGFVDTVRQRLEGQLDPVPSFAADVVEHANQSLGVIRVYESSDTPHILLVDGSIVVREPAKDAKLRQRGRYEATPIRSHYELAQLARRGRDSQDAAEKRLVAGEMPWVEEALRFRWEKAANQRGVFETVMGEQPALILRATPLTMNGRWRDWALSRGGVEQTASLARALLNDEIEVDDPVPHPAGVAVTARQLSGRRLMPHGHRSMTEISTAVLDQGGAIGVRLGFRLQDGDGNLNDWRRLDQGAEIEALAERLLGQVAATLASAEHLGRYAVSLYWLGLGQLYRVDPDADGEGAPPQFLPSGGNMTVDGTDDRTEIEALSHRWALELLRSAGVREWEQGRDES